MKEIKELSDMIRQQEENNLGETATKLNMIVPFLRALGYNDSNPKEFQAEVNVDVGGVLPERVDFACGNGKTMQIFIEAKKAGKRLKNDMVQLKGYYDQEDDIFLGILTNGTEYLFYRDGEEKGKMDEHPFYEIDIRYVDKDDMRFLKKIKKGKITRKSIESIEKDPYLVRRENEQMFLEFCS